MGYVRRVLVASIGAVSLIGAGAVGAGAHDRGTLVEFDSMTPVSGSAVGTVNDRGITGGGLPWAITSGRGEVDRQGRIEVKVTGLVIPVPPFNGTNPASQMAATVSCLTPLGVVNVSTLPQTFPADAAGNVTIEGSVTLPRPCMDPILFVTSSGGAWFAESNSDEIDD
jgi:hypothetical protein